MTASNVLAVGFFDGVHLGHQKILRGASAALTFRNHPLTVLASERAPRLIMSCEDRVAAIRACGVEEVTVLDFTRELAEMPAAEFVDRFLKRKGFRFSAVRCGANWRFGKGGAGDADFLRQAGLSVEVVPTAEYKGERISSTRIRTCLENGRIEDANAMMGRRFEVRGQRAEGKGLATKLGYPTVNLKLQFSTLDSRLLTLPLGVYEVVLNDAKGIANYGVAPTMGDRAWPEPVLEVHLLNLQRQLQNLSLETGGPRLSRPCEEGVGRDKRVPPEVLKLALQPSASIRVELVRFIRPERKFASLDELKRQIAADCATIRS